MIQLVIDLLKVSNDRFTFLWMWISQTIMYLYCCKNCNGASLDNQGFRHPVVQIIENKLYTNRNEVQWQLLSHRSMTNVQNPNPLLSKIESVLSSLLRKLHTGDDSAADYSNTFTKRTQRAGSSYVPCWSPTFLPPSLWHSWLWLSPVTDFSPFTWNTRVCYFRTPTTRLISSLPNCALSSFPLFKCMTSLKCKSLFSVFSRSISPYKPLNTSLCCVFKNAMSFSCWVDFFRAFSNTLRPPLKSSAVLSAIGFSLSRQSGLGYEVRPRPPNPGLAHEGQFPGLNIREVSSAPLAWEAIGILSWGLRTRLTAWMFGSAAVVVLSRRQVKTNSSFAPNSTSLQSRTPDPRANRSPLETTLHANRITYRVLIGSEHNAAIPYVSKHHVIDGSHQVTARSVQTSTAYGCSVTKGRPGTL